LDSADNLYIPDPTTNRVLRVAASTGILTLVAGNGTRGSGGDNGPATQASLNGPYSVAVDPAGNLFILEYNGNRVRRVDAGTGIITTFAGTGGTGFSGDGGPALGATFNFPIAIALDPAQNMYIADMGNARVRRIDAQTGIIKTVAGNGTSGFTPDGLPASNIAQQFGIGVDHAGNLLISEYSNSRIRRVDPATGIISTVAGNGNPDFTGDGIAAVNAGVGKVGMNAVGDSAGNIFFADGTGRIRRVDAVTGIITTIAGNGSGAQRQAAPSGGGGQSCYPSAFGDGGPATTASLDGAFAVALSSNGNLLLSDWLDCRVRRVYLPSPNPYTNTILSVSPSPASTNQPITFTATITPIGTSGSPGGTVQFVYQPQVGQPMVLGTGPVVNGSASFTINAPVGAGTYPIVAYYGGDELTNGSGSPALSLVVASTATPTVTLAADPNPTTLYSNVNFTVTVTPPAGNAKMPTGAVQLSDASGSMLTQTASLTNGSVQFSTSFATVGSHPITAQYLGDASFAQASSLILNETVKGVGGVTLTSDINPSTIGSPVRFTATLVPSTATGTVQFIDGAIPLGTATVANGAAVLVVSNLSAGTHSIQATYGGDSLVTSAMSSILSQTVNLATTTTTVSASISPATYGQAFTVTASVTPSSANGVVSFTDGGTALGGALLSGGTAPLSVTGLSAGSHTIIASYQGDTNNAASTSAPLTQTVNPAAPTFTLVSSLNPSLVGQSVTLTTTMSPPSNGAGLSIQDSQPMTPPVTGTSSAGTTSITLSTLSPGKHSMTATWGGDANVLAGASAVFIQTVQAATTITLTAGAGPFTYGQPVTLTATISPAAATGSIQFSDGATSLGSATITSGTATLTVPSLSVGSHAIGVAYNGDGIYLTSSGALTLPVAKALTTTSLSSSLATSTVGEAVTFTAAVSPNSATGSVQFLDGATVLGASAVNGGGASLSISTLAAGGHGITAVYSGDANNAGSASAAVAVTVSKAASSVAIASSLNPSVASQPVTFTATVSPSSATGTVQFLDGATVLGTGTLSAGSAVFSTATLGVGTHSITASYSGDGTYSASSAGLTQVVKASTTTVLSASNLSPTVGQAVTFTAAVTPATATGSVQFLDGATVLGTAAISGGAAALSTSGLTVGSHSITTIYGGDTNDTSSTSGAVAVTVNKVVSSTVVSSSLNPAVAGQSVALTATVTPSTATGSVQFRDGATVLGTATLSSGSAVFATSILAAGSHSITAVYSGDANTAASTSGQLAQVVSAPPPAAPSHLTATAANSSTINLTWTASTTSGVAYNVYSSANAIFTPSASNRIVSGLTATSYSNTGLPHSTTRYYVVTARNANGESAASNVASATTKGSGISCQVGYTVTTQWNAGFGVAITIQNTGNAPINGWTLTWTWAGNQHITQAWNSDYSQKGADATLTNANWNPTIAAGTTINGIGFNASYSGSNPAPTAFYLNGTKCD
jgi:sugar lactone lactonase YvrE